MFTLRGWAEVGLDADGGRESDDQRALERWIEDAVRTLDIDGVAHGYRNGDLVLTAVVGHNRDLGRSERFIGFLRAVGEQAPGTFGVFYIVDDEQLGNRMDRVVVRRGLVERTSDDLFSPIVPTVHDP